MAARRVRKQCESSQKIFLRRAIFYDALAQLGTYTSLRFKCSGICFVTRIVISRIIYSLGFFACFFFSSIANELICSLSRRFIVLRKNAPICQHAFSNTLPFRVALVVFVENFINVFKSDRVIYRLCHFSPRKYYSRWKKFHQTLKP